MDGSVADGGLLDRIETAGVLPDGNGIDDVVDGRQAAGGVADGLAIDDGA